MLPFCSLMTWIAVQEVAIKEKALGPDHPAVGPLVGGLALVYQAQGRYAEAERLLKRSLAIDEKALGPDHPDVATAMSNLATLYSVLRWFGQSQGSDDESWGYGHADNPFP
jgi:tetratricopeptide (TPR) repeat protein